GIRLDHTVPLVEVPTGPLDFRFENQPSQPIRLKFLELVGELLSLVQVLVLTGAVMSQQTLPELDKVRPPAAQAWSIARVFALLVQLLVSLSSFGPVTAAFVERS